MQCTDAIAFQAAAALDAYQEQRLVLRFWPALVLLAATWQPHASAAQAAGGRDAGERADRVVEVTGKVARSPVLGARAPDGKMGGTIPSAVPGWTPRPGDDKDAYVYVSGRGWILGDTPAERR